MHWSLERMREELRNPQLGSSLLVQQLACMMLVEALRLHLVGGLQSKVGWLSALSDKQMSAAITCLHDEPAHDWTVEELGHRAGLSRSVFALKFKETVGAAPMEYLTRWRMQVPLPKALRKSWAVRRGDIGKAASVGQLDKAHYSSGMEASKKCLI